jgi:hypothetical protein
MRRGAGGQVPRWRRSYAPGPRPPGPAGPVGWEARAGRPDSEQPEPQRALGPAGTVTQADTTGSWYWLPVRGPGAGGRRARRLRRLRRHLGIRRF